MIQKITFNGLGDYNYITEKTEKFSPKRGVDYDEWIKIAERTHARGPEYDRATSVRMIKKNPHLIKNLLNREFVFEPNKINLIFGPNASGKSTIIKALAAYTMCCHQQNLDGITNFGCVGPIDVPDKSLSKITYTADDIKNALTRKAKNSADIVWDGTPVYFENFASRRGYSFGDLTGSLIQSQQEEFLYIFERNKQSAGQQSIWIINKLVSILKNDSNLDVQKIIDNRLTEIKKSKTNDLWTNFNNAVLEYYKGFCDSSITTSERRMTLLIDELDKSLDIVNVISMYNELLPQMVQKLPIQIIAVSHSPIILTKEIIENPLYNIISIDEKYTKTCKKMLSKFSFK